jgi:CDP-diacylglycerol--serine O-phosphatidyltransferase
MRIERGNGRGRMRKVVVVVPSAFTLGNLFFGFWAIVSGFNGNFLWAGWCIVFAGVLDMLDGRIARFSNAGSRFGAELDSLVDLTSFGVAPALLVYLQEFSTGGRFAWLICYLYVVAAAIRLARFNVMAGKEPRLAGWFTGLPSPAAGMTLAVYYAFTRTVWYVASLSYLDLQQQGLAILTLVLAVLMVSNVKYPKWPAAGFHSRARLIGLLIYLVILAGGLLVPEYFLFPLGICYAAYGLLRALIVSLSERHDDDDTADSHPPTLRPDGRHQEPA